MSPENQFLVNNLRAVVCRFLMLCALALALLSLVAVGEARAQGSVPSKQAISAVLNSYGKAYNDRLVAVVGQKGAHQPVVWHIMAYDLKEAGRLSYFQVANGKIVQATLLSAEQSKNRMGAAFKMNDLRKNSTDAFAIANAAARAAKVGFHTLSYEIVGRGPGQAPIYNLELRDFQERVVAELVLDGASGKMIAANWEAQPTVKAYTNPLNRIDWQRIKNTSKDVGRNIGDGFKKFGRDVKRTFSGE